MKNIIFFFIMTCCLIPPGTAIYCHQVFCGFVIIAGAKAAPYSANAETRRSTGFDTPNTHLSQRHFAKKVEMENDSAGIMRSALLPVPQQARFTGRNFNLDKRWAIKTNGISNNIPAVLSLQEELLNRYKLELNTGEGKENNSISFILKENAVKLGPTTDTNRTSLILNTPYPW